jgi:hypothetical protein
VFLNIYPSTLNYRETEILETAFLFAIFARVFFADSFRRESKACDLMVGNKRRQASPRAEQRAVYSQDAMPVAAAMQQEWYNCTGVFEAEGTHRRPSVCRRAGPPCDFAKLRQPPG